MLNIITLTDIREHLYTQVHSTYLLNPKMLLAIKYAMFSLKMHGTPQMQHAPKPDILNCKPHEQK